MATFKVFLSHRYKSPAENLFFFDLFSETKIADLQFEVDGWNNETKSFEDKPTNVTRLERMIRGSHGFLGIYPFPGDSMTVPSPEQLIKESRYFRLELDLAIRSRKPALICFDDRFRAVLPLPSSLRTCEFNAQEVSACATSPSTTGFARHFTSFCEEIEASLAFNRAKPNSERAPKVGLLLSKSDGAHLGYEAGHVDIIESALRVRNDVIRFAWPPVLDRNFFATLADLDWIVTDVGDDPFCAAIAAYVHGAFIPTMRLKRLPEGGDADPPSALERTLFGAVEVGYRKDILRWRTTEELQTELESRLARVMEPAFRISQRTQAEGYFRTAALRKEAVFLSYSGKDSDAGARISAALRKKFEDVFDYKDGKSIRPGEPWLKEIFDKLSRSAIAVLLVSNGYAESDNCAHEAQEIVALRDGKKIRLFPLSLDPPSLSESSKEKLSYLRSTQNLSYADVHHDPDALVRRIVELIDAPK